MTRRARLALVVATLWVAGFEVLPWLHVAFHDSLPEHVHVQGGTVYKVSLDSQTHRHADGTVHRSHGPRRGAPGVALDHGADALAHHAVAAIPAPPPILCPLPVDLRPTLVEPASLDSLASLTVPTAAARGPPSDALAAS